MTGSATVLEVEDLHKIFRIGFMRKRVHAVAGMSFEVRPGEIFGLLGPNGAGKTTTIKTILQLIYPNSGSIRIFGLSPNDQEARKRIGYMPENPYVYQYLKPLEFLDLCGRLCGMKKEERQKRAAAMIETVGLGHAIGRPIGRFSKGMMQRIGLAQALLHDPDFLLLDEPMSGLDPIGRKEIRDLLLELRARGKTLIFTSHILSDVEMLCDRVVIMREGRLAAQGTMHDLLDTDTHLIEVQITRASPELRQRATSFGRLENKSDGVLTIHIEGHTKCDEFLKLVSGAGAGVVSVIPERQTLERLFIRNAVQHN